MLVGSTSLLSFVALLALIILEPSALQKDKLSRILPLFPAISWATAAIFLIHEPMGERINRDWPYVIGSIIVMSLVAHRLISTTFYIRMFLMTQQTVTRANQGWVAVTGDVAWVIMSIILIVSNWLPLTTHGQWTILIVSDIVLLFAIAQYIGIRRLNQQ